MKINYKLAIHVRQRVRMPIPSSIKITSASALKLPSKKGDSVQAEVSPGSTITVTRGLQNKLEVIGMSAGKKVPVRRMKLTEQSDEKGPDGGYCLFCIDDSDGNPNCIEIECDPSPTTQTGKGKGKGSGPGKKPLPIEKPIRKH